MRTLWILTLGLTLLCVSAYAGADYRALDSEFSSALKSRDIAWLSRHLDPRITEKADLKLEQLIHPSWRIEHYKLLSVVVDNLGPAKGNVVTVVADIGSRRQDIIVMYWRWHENRWTLLNFPFHGSGVPNAFPFAFPEP